MPVPGRVPEGLEAKVTYPTPLMQTLLLTSMVLLLTSCATLPPEPERPAAFPVMGQPAPAPVSATASFTAVPSAAAAERIASATVLRLEDVLDEVIQHNPALLAEFEDFRARLLKSPQMTALPDPMVTYKQYLMDTRMESGELMLSQGFPWFGKRALKGQIADTEATEGLEMYRERLLEVRLETIQEFISLSFEYEAREIAERERDYLVQMRDTAMILYEAGRTGRQPLLKADTEIARLETDLLGYPARIRASEAKLNRLMDRPAQSRLGRPVHLPMLALPLDHGDLHQAAVEHRPEIRRWETLDRKARLESSLARREYYPDLMAGVGVMGIGDDAGEWNLEIGLTIPFPNARRKAMSLEAERRRQEAQLRKEETLNRIDEELEGLLARLDWYSAELDAYRQELLPVAEEAVETSRSEYTAGEGAFLDLLDSERMLLDIRLGELRAQRDYLMTLAELERVIGAALFHPAPGAAAIPETTP